jgi:hypothetical protein
MTKEQLRYKGPIHCALTVLKEEGLRGMWSGATPTVLRNGTNQVRLHAVHAVKPRAPQLTACTRCRCASSGPSTTWIHCSGTSMREMASSWQPTSPCLQVSSQLSLGQCASCLCTCKQAPGQPGQPVAAAFVQLATGPFDVIKTRLMAQSKGGGDIRYKVSAHLPPNRCWAGGALAPGSWPALRLPPHLLFCLLQGLLDAMVKIPRE